MKTLDGAYILALKDILGLVNSGAGLKRTLNSMARRTVKAMSADGATIFLLDSRNEFLVPTGYYGLTDVFLHKGPLRAGRSIPQILRGKVTSVYDVPADPRIEYPEAARLESITSLLGVPIWSRAAVIGQFRIYSRKPRRFSAQDKDFASAVTAIVTVILDKAEANQALARSSLVPSPGPVEDQPEYRPSPTFAHPSEAEFARFLDFYRIEWLYEPRSFPIKWNGVKPVEFFTPDFYLPELDLYIELTTMKQKLATEKNRKIRRLKELYPEINVRLLNKGDYTRLLAKYGYGPLAGAKVRGTSQILISHSQIQRRITQLGKKLSRDYAGKELMLVGVLKGMVCFMSDLMQHISVPVKIDFMAISSFAAAGEDVVTITRDLSVEITDKHVVLVEDIVDTGMTLKYILEHIRASKPASLTVCALLDKRARRLIDVPLAYVGFEVPDDFVVGYGLDYNEEYRNLPFIGVLATETKPES